MISSDIKLDESSKITAFKLMSQPASNGKIFLGSIESNVFIVVDSSWSKLTEIFKNSEITVEHVAKMLDEKNVTKVKLMILSMAQAKLIRKIDDEVIHDYRETERGIKDKLFLKFSLFLANPLFVLFSIFLAVTFLFIFSDFRNIPKAQDFFWSSLFSLNLVSAFFFSWICVLVHETAHLIIARIYGIKGTLRIGHRLNFLVVESKFPNLYSIPKIGRIAVSIAGVILDMALTADIYFLHITHPELPILKQFILLLWLSILWQFFFYMKTDVYFVIKEIVGVENLYAEAKRKILDFFKNKKSKYTGSKRGGRIVAAYSIILFLGTGLGLFRYGFYHIPILIKTFSGAFIEIFNGTNVVDGVITILIEGFSLLLLGITYLKKKE